VGTRRRLRLAWPACWPRLISLLSVHDYPWRRTLACLVVLGVPLFGGDGGWYFLQFLSTVRLFVYSFIRLFVWGCGASRGVSLSLSLDPGSWSASWMGVIIVYAYPLALPLCSFAVATHNPFLFVPQFSHACPYPPLGLLLDASTPDSLVRHAAATRPLVVMRRVVSVAFLLAF
jgi:hypothetical protein